jgi:hypothetical protein
MCPIDGDFLACFYPLTDAHLRLLFRSSDMPNKAPRRMPYGQVAPHHLEHILGPCTDTTWAMAGRLGDTIPGSLMANMWHRRTRHTIGALPFWVQGNTASKCKLVGTCVEGVFGTSTRKGTQAFIPAGLVSTSQTPQKGMFQGNLPHFFPSRLLHLPAQSGPYICRYGDRSHVYS